MGAYQLMVKEPGEMADVFRTTLSYQNIEESRHNRKFNRPDRRNQIEQVDVWGLTADFQKSIFIHNFQYGLEA